MIELFGQIGTLDLWKVDSTDVERVVVRLVVCQLEAELV
jgi:hypothetical protein